MQIQMLAHHKQVVTVAHMSELRVDMLESILRLGQRASSQTFASCLHGCIGQKALGIFPSADRRGRRKEVRRPMRLHLGKYLQDSSSIFVNDFL